MIDEIEHNVNALEYLFSKVITYAGEGQWDKSYNNYEVTFWLS